MQSLILQLFDFLGFSLAPPTNFGEALPWLLQVGTGLAIVLFILRFFKAVTVAIAGRRF